MYIVKAAGLEKAFLTFLARFPLCLLPIASCLHLGRACPPHWVFQGFVALDKFLVETKGGVGGALTHPRLQHWVKWLWEQVWDFSALGSPTSSVSRRLAKLTITIRCHCHSKREAMGTKSETLSCSWFQALGVGRLWWVWHMHNGCDFWN